MEHNYIHYLYSLPVVLMMLFAAAPFSAKGKYETATFAVGCFWCMVAPFEKLDGVVEVVSGYTGGIIESPDYEKVSSGATEIALALGNLECGAVGNFTETSAKNTGYSREVHEKTGVSIMSGIKYAGLMALSGGLATPANAYI